MPETLWNRWLKRVSPPPPTPKMTEAQAGAVALCALKKAGHQEEWVNQVWRSVNKDRTTLWEVWIGYAPKGSGFKVEINDETSEVLGIFPIPR